MKLAIFAPPFGPYDARRLAELAALAEQSGWDGFFIWDHIAGYNYPARQTDAWVALAAIAMRTERIRIGPMVTPIPRRRPHKLARETVSVDHLSGGRLTLGVGIGEGAGEFEDLGDEGDMKARGQMLDEGLLALMGLWTAQPFTLEGRFYTLRNVTFEPAPLQQPRIPVWAAGKWPARAPLRRAASLDGFFPVGNPTPDILREMRSIIMAHRSDPAAPFDLATTGRTSGTDSAADADVVGPYIEAGLTWWMESISPWRFGWGKDTAAAWPLEQMAERIAAGPPRLG